MRKSLSFHSSVRYFKYIVLVLLFYPLTVLGAQGHITVKGQSITIKEAIMLIEKNSNYVFFYNAADLKNIRLKNINCSGPIDKVLNEVFANTGITYLIQGNDVVLKVSKTESAQQAKKTEIATFDEDQVYDQNDSAGFINLFGLPIKVRAKKGLIK